MTLWTAQDAAAATGGDAIGNWAISGISIDTRDIQNGDLFVALKAARDGHDFVADALAKGAAAALVSRHPEGVAKDAPLLIVDDVLAGLEALGRAGRARFAGKVVAITGSVGKTSTKEMLRTVLEKQGKTHAAEKSFNNHWGVPITLAKIPEDADFAVIEIGMNHPGEIGPLAKMAKPHVAMITTVAAAHLEAFENVIGIAHEKAAIFDGLTKNGIAVINGDLDTTEILDAAAQAHLAQIIHFGEKSGVDYQLTDVVIGDDCTTAKVKRAEGDALFKLQSSGRHFATNGAGVLAVVAALGADIGIAATDLAGWIPPEGRGQRMRVVLDGALGDGFDLIDDAFNANPTSMAASIEVLAAASVPNGARRIAVLGDMLELGPDEEQMHIDIRHMAGFDAIDVVHAVGPRMKALWSTLDADQQGEWVETASELAQDIHRHMRVGDLVLVKGSKGSMVSRVVDALLKLGQVSGERS
ncbi:MAG: UDP-N-acetylmuramoyl-tripeptide--D-alanyl-D-alanine ligase [Halocynthiibacter sp.]